MKDEEGRDPARPLPGERMPSREEIAQELNKHDIGGFKVFDIGSEEVKLAIKVLEEIGEDGMALFI